MPIFLVDSIVRDFEKKMEHYLEDKVYVNATNSGTAAIHLGLVVCSEIW